MPSEKVKVYESKKSGFNWLWLLPLLLLIPLMMWLFGRDRTPEAARATANNAADTLRRTGRLSLGDADVKFNTGSAQLAGGAQNVLDDVGGALRDNADWRLRVVGHTDSTGDAAANQTLAQQRAESVAGYLAGKGVDRSRLRVAAQGERAPEDTNATTGGRAENRRVELIKE